MNGDANVTRGCKLHPHSTNAEAELCFENRVKEAFDD